MIAGGSPLSTQTTLAVNVSHDKQESVWYVLSSDIPGLHAEAETLDELVAVISDVAPDLIAANLGPRFR
jgi:predicted RNase H-like HicB family nuclease